MSDYTDQKGKFKKGNPGRKKGTRNKRTESIRKFIYDLLEGQEDKILVELNELKGEPYIRAVNNLLKYAVPTLTSTEVTGDFVAIDDFVKMNQDEQKQYLKDLLEDETDN